MRNDPVRSCRFRCLRGPICRSVIDDHHFELETALQQPGAQGGHSRDHLLDVVDLVVGGDDHHQQPLLVGLWRPLYSWGVALRPSNRIAFGLPSEPSSSLARPLQSCAASAILAKPACLLCQSHLESLAKRGFSPRDDS